MRDAGAHTALLTNPAKERLRTVRENIKARINTLLVRETGLSSPVRKRKGGADRTLKRKKK